MELIRTCFVLAGLFANTIKDLKEREISIGITVCLAGVGLIFRFIDHTGIEELFFSLLPGLIFWLLAFVSRQQLGYGDAWVLMAIGCCLTYQETLVAFLLSLASISMVALFLCAVFHKNRKYELPYVPFLFAGVVCVRCLGV